MKEKSNKSIIITGATGFLGSNVLNSLLKQGYNTIVLKRKHSSVFRIKKYLKKIKCFNVESVDFGELFSENKIDTVIHCATNYGRSYTSSVEIIDANLILPLKLLEYGGMHGLRCFINTDTILDKRLNDYTLSKSQFGQWFTHYSSKIVCVNIELEHFYGPNDNQSKFITYIIRSFLNNVDAIDLTKGEQKRYFIYIDDVIDAFEKIIAKSKYLENGFYRFQIASDKANTIKEFVLKVKSITKNTRTKLNFGVVPYRKNEVMNPKINMKNLKEIGWKQKFSLEQGLKMTVAEERRNLK